eukprot:6408691-Amphidinium_carterae.1
MSFTSPDFAAVVLKRPMPSLKQSCPAFQFRGLFFTSERRQTCLCKGMMKIDWTLTALMCRLTSSCVKTIGMGVAEDVEQRFLQVLQMIEQTPHTRAIQEMPCTKKAWKMRQSLAEESQSRSPTSSRAQSV